MIFLFISFSARVVDCTLVGLIPGVRGDGTSAKVTFCVKSAGESSLHLYDVTLLDSYELPINCSTVDGYGSFTSSTDSGGGGGSSARTLLNVT